MGLFDKVKDFLDDGKINGSNKKPQQPEVQPAQPVQPVQTAAAVNQQPAPVSAPTPSEQVSANTGDAVDFRFGMPCPMPYRDTDGRTVMCVMAGTATLKAAASPIDKQRVNALLMSAPQTAIQEVLVKNSVPSSQFESYTDKLSENIAQQLKNGLGSDYEVQSVVVQKIRAQ